MKKSVKRLVTFLLVTVMVFSGIIPALAADLDESQFTDYEFTDYEVADYEVADYEVADYEVADYEVTEDVSR